jgi:hypothetical protein
MKTVRSVCLWASLIASGMVIGGAAVFALYDRLFAPAQTLEELPRRWEATIYLPLADSRDQPLSSERWDQAIEMLAKEFGGATLGSEIEGRWRDKQSRVHRERVRPIIVSFEHGRMNDLRRVLSEVGRLLDQDAIYARFEEPRILLLPIEKVSQKAP